MEFIHQLSGSYIPIGSMMKLHAWCWFRLPPNWIVNSLSRNPLFTNHSWPIHDTDTHGRWYVSKGGVLWKTKRNGSVYTVNSSSLKLRAKVPENRPSAPKRKFHLPTIHFRVILLVSGRVFWETGLFICLLNLDVNENFIGGTLVWKVWNRGPHLFLSAIIFGKFHHKFFACWGCGGKNTSGWWQLQICYILPQTLGKWSNLDELLSLNGWAQPPATPAIQQRSVSSPGMMCPVTICTSQLMIVNGLLHLPWWATVPRQQWIQGERSCRSKKTQVSQKEPLNIPLFWRG